MRFIKHTYHFLPMHSAYDFDFLLKLALGISTVVFRFKSQLVKKSFIKPSWLHAAFQAHQENVMSPVRLLSSVEEEGLSLVIVFTYFKRLRLK